MTDDRPQDDRPRPGPARPGCVAADEEARALADAAASVGWAPSWHDTRPWTVVLHADRLELRTEPSRLAAALDPSGRALVQSVGAALCNVRVALAARGWGEQVDRLPSPADPDLLAVVRPAPTAPEPGLALLAPALPRRRTHRGAMLGGPLPEQLLQHLAELAAAEDTELVPVGSAEHRRCVERLTREAAAAQAATAGTPPGRGHWVPPEPDAGSPQPPGAASDPAGDDFYLVLATRSDDLLAWLRSGEALERVLLELARLGWSAGPVTQAVEVPLTRAGLQAALTWDWHPQALIRVGRPARAGPGSGHGAGERQAPPPADDPASRLAPRGGPAPRTTPARPVPDGRGGTVWI
jgi:nitroreductase